MMALRGEIGLVKKVTPELVGANITRGLARLSPIKVSTVIIYYGRFVQIKLRTNYRENLVVQLFKR